RRAASVASAFIDETAATRPRITGRMVCAGAPGCFWAGAKGAMPKERINTQQPRTPCEAIIGASLGARMGARGLTSVYVVYFESRTPRLKPGIQRGETAGATRITLLGVSAPGLLIPSYLCKPIKLCECLHLITPALLPCGSGRCIGMLRSLPVK